MNISFDKALLWGLPYLYLVSISYYWGFWGTFDIDAFSYYAVSDIVKGITAPISTTLVYIVTLIAALLFLNFSEKIMGQRYKLIKVLVAGVLVVVTAFFAVTSGFFTKTRVDTRILDDKLSAIEYTIYAVSLATATTVLILSIKKDRTKDNIFYYCALLFGILLPGRSFITGKETALRIEQSKEFDYVVADSLAGPKQNIYKFLGKTGDYYVLLTYDNIKHIVVPIDKLSPLIVERFSLDDLGSVRRFKAHQKDLAAIASPLAPSKPTQ